MFFKKIILLLFAILIIVLTWPIFPAWIPALEKPWWLYPLGIVVGFFFAREYFLTKQFRYLVLYGVVILLNSLWGDKYIYDPIVVLTRFCGFLFLTSAPYVLLKPGNEKYSKIIFYVFFLLLIYTTIISIFLNNLFPDVIRNDVSITGEKEIYEFAFLYKFGLTRYQFAHAVPILIPPLVMGYKYAKHAFLNKIFYLLCVLLCIAHTFVSGSTTAFLMSVIATVLSFAVVKGSAKTNMRRLLVLSILLLPLLSSSVLSSLLGMVDMVTGSEGPIHYHIVDMQYSLIKEGSEGDVRARQDLYSVSLRSFFANPIIGTNDKMGNHSVFVDHLGAFGLLGFIPFFSLLWVEYKNVLYKIGARYKFYYMISMICAFGMFAFKNASYWNICCFLYIGAPIFLTQLAKNK